MKESPIIFSTEMVRAILEGRKTQTRRVIKPQPTEYGLRWATACGGDFAAWQDPGLMLDEHSEAGGPCQRKCPYGRVGDRLWVRETWQYHDWTEDGEPFVGYRADGAVVLPENVSEEWCDRLEGIWARLSVPENYDIDNRAADRRWRPSIHMPRWASRITLEIVKVRVERVQEITEEDATDEGAEPLREDSWRNPGLVVTQSTATEEYQHLWDSLNSKRGYSWESNPWVWVIEFRLLGK